MSHWHDLRFELVARHSDIKRDLRSAFLSFPSWKQISRMLWSKILKPKTKHLLVLLKESLSAEAIELFFLSKPIAANALSNWASTSLSLSFFFFFFFFFSLIFDLALDFFSHGSGKVKNIWIEIYFFDRCNMYWKTSILFNKVLFPFPSKQNSITMVLFALVNCIFFFMVTIFI